MTRPTKRIDSPSRPRLGVSSCLLGNAVRYDGGHKRDTFITKVLAEHFELQPVCPEVAIGLGIPRPTLRLLRKDDEVRVVGVQDKDTDVTDPLAAYAAHMVSELADICGYLFKKDSPSCGVWGVPLYAEDEDTAERSGSGEYARAFRQHLPWLPVEEEGRLNDPVLRENFLLRVFTLFRWQELTKGGLQPSDLVDFHSRHKFLILAHSQRAYQELGDLVARAGSENFANLSTTYITRLMQVLTKTASRRGHSNVLQHLQGYLMQLLDSDDRQELAEVISSYRLAQVPLIVPITLLKHHFRRNPNPNICNQVYLDPHPGELMLRNLI